MLMLTCSSITLHCRLVFGWYCLLVLFAFNCSTAKASSKSHEHPDCACLLCPTDQIFLYQSELINCFCIKVQCSDSAGALLQADA